MKNCTNCGRQLVDDLMFCDICGLDQSKQSEHNVNQMLPQQQYQQYNPYAPHGYNQNYYTPPAKKYSKDIILTVLAIIGVPLFIQIIIHGSVWYGIIDTQNLYGFFIPSCLYAFVYAFISSFLIILKYRDQKKIKNIMITAICTYVAMLPVLYFCSPIILAGFGSGIEGFFYFVSGILVIPLLIIKNATVFFVIMLIWYVIKKTLHKNQRIKD